MFVGSVHRSFCFQETLNHANMQNLRPFGLRRNCNLSCVSFCFGSCMEKSFTCQSKNFENQLPKIQIVIAIGLQLQVALQLPFGLRLRCLEPCRVDCTFGGISKCCRIGGTWRDDAYRSVVVRLGWMIFSVQDSYHRFLPFF